MPAAGKPIVDRLDQLAGQWLDFAGQAEARVLCWLCAPDELAMVDAFVGMEDDDRVGQTEDLFVPLQAPFVAARYGEGLLREFIERAGQLYAGLEDPNTPAWQPPPVAPRAQDPLPLLQACQSFIDHYKLPGRLVLYLTPSDVPDVGAFRAWLELVTRNALPKMPKLRLVLRDDRKSPALAPLVQALPNLVVAMPADLDMAGARLDISENAGNLDKPGGQFRHQFVQMSNAMGEPDLAAADQHGKAALEIAASQGWHALAIPIHLAMGAALAGAGKTEEANRRYVNAESAAVAGEQAGDPVCAKLRVQARMCRGGLLIHAGAWQMAAALYAETLPLAKAVNDPGMIIDCHRLASFSHEQAKQLQPAWQQGVDGLAYARTVEKKTLSTTTLGYLGVGLERLCKGSQWAGSWRRIEQELASLLGPQWRPAAAQPKGAAP
jgi:hypothetical protein